MCVELGFWWGRVAVVHGRSDRATPALKPRRGRFSCSSGRWLFYASGGLGLRVFWGVGLRPLCRGAGARDKLQAGKFKYTCAAGLKGRCRLLSDKSTACSTSGFANGDARAPL